MPVNVIITNHRRVYSQKNMLSVEIDFRNGENIAPEYKGKYSTQVFAERAVQIIRLKSHS